MGLGFSGSVDVLVLAAFAPELAGMRRLLGEGLRGEVAGVEVACEVVGVGLPSASSGTTARLIGRRPRAVVLVGTAGVYPQHDYGIGDGVVVRGVRLVDPGEVEGRAAMPDAIVRWVECDAATALGLASGGATATLATTLSITTDDGLARVVAPAVECALENLEAFGVANACALQGVPFGCVMGVANRVGSSGRAEWRTHHDVAARAACEIVNRWLTGGAQGLPTRET